MPRPGAWRADTPRDQLTGIRQPSEGRDTVDITQLILDDHAEQRRLFAMIDQIDRSDSESLTAIWQRLAAFLDLHAEAEEQIFYPALLHLGAGSQPNKTPESETDDAIGDHNDIRDAVAEVSRHQAGSKSWYAAVMAANKANGEHMAEEEREGLTDFRQHAALQIRHDLAVTFAAFEARHVAGVEAVDKDPDDYIRQHRNGN